MRMSSVFDATLRDGEQAPGNAMTIEQELELAVKLETLGVHPNGAHSKDLRGVGFAARFAHRAHEAHHRRERLCNRGPAFTGLSPSSREPGDGS
ncbi:hypothetical protein [Pendulispora albinea]|uniref:hypothetical protein n=1 Tax=Pendulispora albinea TaxID=2741071 RepID=UPI00374E0A57